MKFCMEFCLWGTSAIYAENSENFTLLMCSGKDGIFMKKKDALVVSGNEQIAPVIMLTDTKGPNYSNTPVNTVPVQSQTTKNGKVKRPGRGFAITGFVLGILCILLVFVSVFDPWWIPLLCGLGIASSIMGIIFSAIGKKKGDDSGFGTAGLIMSIVPLGIFALLIFAFFGVVGCFGALIASACAA